MAKICTLCHGAIRFGDVKFVCEECWDKQFREVSVDPINSINSTNSINSIDPGIMGSSGAEWVEWECAACFHKDSVIRLDTELQKEQADKIADLRTSLKMLTGKLKRAKDELNELKGVEKGDEQ